MIIFIIQSLFVHVISNSIHWFFEMQSFLLQSFSLFHNFFRMRFLILCLFLVSVSLADITCTTGQTYVKFTKKCGASYASEESFEIWSGGSKIYTSPTFANNEERTIEQCLASSTNNQYQLKMKDGYGDSWSGGSFLTIEGPYGNRVFKAFLADSYEED